MKFEYRNQGVGRVLDRDRRARIRRVSNGVKVVAYAWLVIEASAAGWQASRGRDRTPKQYSIAVVVQKDWRFISRFRGIKEFNDADWRR
jgi:hypothetical protein